jgi:sortase A
MSEAGAPHRAKHRAVDQDEIATRMLPRIVVPEEASAVARPAPHPPPPLPPPPHPPPPPLSAPQPPPEDQPDAGDQHPKGVQVVPLRPVRTEEGYRSVYSDLTRRTFRSVSRTVMRGSGELLITFGLIVLLFAAYEVWGKAAIVEARQNDLQQRLDQAWAAAPTVAPNGPSPAPSTGRKPADGQVIAALYIPRLNKHWVVVQGVTPADIRYAPGHYPNTALPGQIGNFSMAGHRTPSIFWDLDRLKTGDPVIVETADTWYVYTVVQSHVVTPNAVQVIAAVPNQPGVPATKAMLTMTTCNPKFNNYQRLVVHAELARTDTHSAGRPPELGG